MASRASDWWRQAQRDLAHARNAMEDEDFEWSCFAAQQAAEKAIKALYQHLHQEAWGHVVHQLLEMLPKDIAASDELVDRGKRLDRHYVPTRYPNGFASGAPGDFYTSEDAGQAIEDAEVIHEFCARHLT
jgi:HEPN domain-containing protein